MSSFINAANPQSRIEADDQRLYSAWWRVPIEIARHGDSVGDVASFMNAYWPGSAGLTGDAGDSQCGALEAIQFDLWDPTIGTGGAASRFGFVGVTRDQYGSIIGGCTVRLFRTSDNALLDSTVSDATTGAFLLNTPFYPDAHYLVSHKTGSPDVAGVTPNTLIGT